MGCFRYFSLDYFHSLRVFSRKSFPSNPPPVITSKQKKNRHSEFLQMLIKSLFYIFYLYSQKNIQKLFGNSSRYFFEDCFGKSSNWFSNGFLQKFLQKVLHKMFNIFQEFFRNFSTDYLSKDFSKNSFVGFLRNSPRYCFTRFVIEFLNCKRLQWSC